MNESDQPLCSLATSSTLNYKLIHVGKAVIFLSIYAPMYAFFKSLQFLFPFLTFTLTLSLAFISRCACILAMVQEEERRGVGGRGVCVCVGGGLTKVKEKTQYRAEA